MSSYPQSNDYLPGTWKGLKPGSVPGGKRSATFTCTNGHTCTLLIHTIADDGTVTPSVVCPYEGCGFHEFIQLEGWQPE
jgi:hypothetical protein